MKLRKYIIVIDTILLILVGFTVGYYFDGLTKINYDEIFYQKKTAGFYQPNATLQSVQNSKKYLDYYGDWVCINVKKMTFPRAYEVCVHECSHRAFDEIFAEECENNPEQCIKQMEDFFKNETKE
jgi:hypothetical protein